jgi:hypothetical protein
MKKFLSFLVLFVLLISSSAFALSPSARLILFSGDGRLSGASVDFNFTQSQYYGCNLNCISLSRASPGYAQTLAGTWQSFGSNVLRITDQGLLIEEARTNKCTNFNANPTDTTNITLSGDAAATLTVVDDTAALAAAGLQNIATSGKVFKLDNSGGSGSADAIIGGATGNTNAHSVSAFARVTAGNAFIRFNGSNVVTYSTSSYARGSATNIVPLSTATVTIRANAGSVVYFILNQLEEGPFVTSPIVTAGASATRAADIPQLTGAALTAALNAKAAFFQTNLVAAVGASPTNFPRMVAYGGGQDMFFTSTTAVDLAGLAIGTLGSGNSAGLVKSAFGFDASGLTARANGGTIGTSATAWTGTSPAYIGNRSAGDRALNGYMQRFALSPNKGQFDNKTQ